MGISLFIGYHTQVLGERVLTWLSNGKRHKMNGSQLLGRFACKRYLTRKRTSSNKLKVLILSLNTHSKPLKPKKKQIAQRTADFVGSTPFGWDEKSPTESVTGDLTWNWTTPEEKSMYTHVLFSLLLKWQPLVLLGPSWAGPAVGRRFPSLTHFGKNKINMK